jgi:hypothetical protein
LEGTFLKDEGGKKREDCFLLILKFEILSTKNETNTKHEIPNDRRQAKDQTSIETEIAASKDHAGIRILKTQY